LKISGKTLISMAVASSVPNLTLFKITPASVVDKYLGTSEKIIKAIFAEMIARPPSLLGTIHKSPEQFWGLFLFLNSQA
jgi:ATP-dependent 26S proteasome regulatory subunit